MKAYLAIVLTPLGAWESTASVCTGHEGQYRAREMAKNKFLTENLPPFMKTGLGLLADSYWRAAQSNGCRILEREIEIEQTGGADHG
jgi:hypothetical protein